MILLLDNYDSFTFNLKQYLLELNQKVEVIRNNAITIDDIQKDESVAYRDFSGTGQT